MDYTVEFIDEDGNEKMLAFASAKTALAFAKKILPVVAEVDGFPQLWLNGMNAKHIDALAVG